eukprot:SAG25_NODE_285_length_10382_cov_55.777108_9_plen_186_part_00
MAPLHDTCQSARWMVSGLLVRTSARGSTSAGSSKLLSVHYQCKANRSNCARLAVTDGRPRRWHDPAGDCQQPTRATMRGGAGALQKQVLRTLKYALAKRQKTALAQKEKRDNRYLQIGQTQEVEKVNGNSISQSIILGAILGAILETPHQTIFMASCRCADFCWSTGPRQKQFVPWRASCCLVIH